MSSAIYALTMLLLLTQLYVDAKILKGLELFGYFVAVIYVKHWLKAPVVAKAATSNLQLYKLLLAHERIPMFKDVSVAALSALKRYLWYLTEKLVPFCIVFSVLTNYRSTLNKIWIRSYFAFTKNFQRQTCLHRI